MFFASLVLLIKPLDSNLERSISLHIFISVIFVLLAIRITEYSRLFSLRIIF